MKRNTVTIFLLVIVCILAQSCSKRPEEIRASAERLTSTQPEKLAITKVTQTMNLNYDRLFPAVLSLLESKGIPVEHANSARGKIVTKPLEMEELLCGTFGADRAPISCVTIYSFQLRGLTPVASSFAVSYEETCESFGPHNLECPESKAEEVLLELVDELKVIGGVVDSK